MLGYGKLGEFRLGCARLGKFGLVKLRRINHGYDKLT
jgi:hypothetical protein